MAGQKIQSILSHAPGNDQAIGGLKVMTETAGSPHVLRAPKTSTENHAESFIGDDHLKQLVAEATLVDGAICTK